MIRKLSLARTRRAVAVAGLVLSSACATGGPAALPEGAVTIARQGSFEAGGKLIGDQATSSLACDHGHVEYQVPVQAKPVSLFLWHSSSVAVWQRRWDGGEGYQMKLLRAGYPTYTWDGPRVGRANWGCENYSYEAELGRDQHNFEAWRFGPRSGQFYAGEQFPVEDAEALEQANRARYQEFDTLDNLSLQSDAAAKAIDRIGPSVLLTNSAAGLRALLTRLKTDNVKGIVAYENTGYVLPDTLTPKLKERAFGPIYVPEKDFARLAGIPIQLVWGDHTDESSTWVSSMAQAQLFAEELRKSGGNVELLKLPDAGLKGNSHIPFADMNNDQVAALLFNWLDRHGL